MTNPALTPPSIVRAVTLEEHERRLGNLEASEAENFASVRRVEAKLEAFDARAEARHRAVMDAVLRPPVRFSFWGLLK